MNRVWKVCVMLALGCGIAFGQAQLQAIYSFNSKLNDGVGPTGPIVFDVAGNLYGTTSIGGVNHAGVVFQLSKSGNTWNETVLYNFCSLDGCSDGRLPDWGVITDASGNLFGTTRVGGVSCPASSAGCGIAFELSPPLAPGGTWTENVLWTFGENAGDGCIPTSPLTFDQEGNLFGTLGECGLNAEGAVFELSPPAISGEAWTETILYNFCGENVHQNCFDGAEPLGSLALDSAGNIYGATYKGGLNSGIVFELSPPHSGDSWSETVLYKFRINRGGNPNTGVTFDKSGNLYGSLSGEHVGVGGYFKLTPTGIEHQFEFKAGDGPALAAPLIENGTLYGENAYGYGQLFSLQARKETILHTFCTPEPPCSDGEYPESPLIKYGNHLYGTTNDGGDFYGGTVYEVSW